MAWHLARHHLRFIVLEAGPEMGHSWQSRWDSLILFTPTQHGRPPRYAISRAAGHYPTKTRSPDLHLRYMAPIALIAEFALKVGSVR